MCFYDSSLAFYTSEEEKWKRASIENKLYRFTYLTKLIQRNVFGRSLWDKRIQINFTQCLISCCLDVFLVLT